MTLKFTAKGRAKLRRARSATLTISGAGAPLNGHPPLEIREAISKPSSHAARAR